MSAVETAAVAPVQGGTTSQFTTDSTNDVCAGLRRALLDFAKNGRSARNTIDERLYEVRAPDKLTFPYAVQRLSTRSDGRFHGMRLDGTLEVQVYGRPWAQQRAVNDVCDLFDQAMLTLVLNHQGLIFCHQRQRDTLPVAGAPIDSEVVTVRLSYTLTIYPAFLTSLTRVLPPLE